METKTIAECEHEVRIECSAVPTRKDCKDIWETILQCGHRCKKRCSEPCSSGDCVELVKTSTKNLCNHFVAVPCKDFHAGIKLSHLPSYSILILTKKYYFTFVYFSWWSSD